MTYLVNTFLIVWACYICCCVSCSLWRYITWRSFAHSCTTWCWYRCSVMECFFIGGCCQFTKKRNTYDTFFCFTKTFCIKFLCWIWYIINHKNKCVDERSAFTYCWSVGEWDTLPCNKPSPRWWVCDCMRCCTWRNRSKNDAIKTMSMIIFCRRSYGCRWCNVMI